MPHSDVRRGTTLLPWKVVHTRCVVRVLGIQLQRLQVLQTLVLLTGHVDRGRVIRRGHSLAALVSPLEPICHIDRLLDRSFP